MEFISCGKASYFNTNGYAMLNNNPSGWYAAELFDSNTHDIIATNYMWWSQSPFVSVILDYDTLKKSSNHYVNKSPSASDLKNSGTKGLGFRCYIIYDEKELNNTHTHTQYFKHFLLRFKNSLLRMEGNNKWNV